MDHFREPYFPFCRQWHTHNGIRHPLLRLCVHHVLNSQRRLPLQLKDIGIAPLRSHLRLLDIALMTAASPPHVSAPTRSQFSHTPFPFARARPLERVARDTYLAPSCCFRSFHRCVVRNNGRKKGEGVAKNWKIGGLKCIFRTAHL